MDRGRLNGRLKRIAKYLKVPLLIAVAAAVAFAFFLHDSDQSATACVKGTLTVIKKVNLSGAVNGNSITKNFTITVKGPSYPAGISKTFTLSGGTVTPAKWKLENLILGTYNVSEDDPGAEWQVSGTGDITLSKCNYNRCKTVTNTFVPGSLKVTKVVNLGDVVNGNSIDETFEITVTGPSYPTGISQTFTLSGGSVSPSEWNLTNLIPGTYTITEADPGPEWTVSGTGDVVVNPGCPSASATVTNTFVPGSLKVTKVVNLGGADPESITENFTITVTGPSYPTGISQIFTLSGGSVSPSEWNLTNLIPGIYTVTEDDPGAEWLVSGEGDVVVNPGCPSASATVTNDYQKPPEEPRCSIGDTVWLDKDGDGIQDADEPGIAEVVVQLWKGETFADETETDSNGFYQFTGLEPGCYTVIIPEENFEPGGALQGLEPTYDYDGNLDNQTDICLAEPGEYFLDADFGYRTPPEEPPVPGVTMWGIVALLAALAGSGILMLRKKSLVN